MSVPATKAPLVGRDRELALIDECLDAARRGEGSSLMLVGEPGSGKTSLLAEARRRAGDDFVVVACTGVEWEAELPFGGLHELLTPLLGHLDALPDPQRRALEVALGVALADDDAGHALHLFAGVASTLAEATRSGPVLLIADDLQWIDGATCEALSFVARRLTGEAVALLVGTRPGTPLPGLPSAPHDLEPLSDDAVGVIAQTVLGRPLLVEAVAELAQLSAGNPLAVTEGLRHLGDEIWARGSLLDAPLRVGDYIEHGFSDRIEQLSPAARLAAEVISATIDSSAVTIELALVGLGIDRDALAEAERAGIVELVASGVRFAHPVLRSLVHREAPPERLRRCHTALAGALRNDPDLRAWHVACATMEPEEGVAAALEIAADHFTRRGGSIASSQALARAAALTPSPDRRAERLLRAGRQAYRAGRNDRARHLFADARACTDDPRLVLQSDLFDALRGAHSDYDRDTLTELERIIERAAGVDTRIRSQAVPYLVNEVTLSGRGERLDEARTLLREEQDHGEVDPHWRLEAVGLHAHLELLTAVSATVLSDAASTIRGCADQREDYGSTFSPMLVEALVWIEEHERAHAVSVDHLAGARRAGDALLLTAALWAEGLRLLNAGRWTEARRDLTEAVQICHAVGSQGNAAMIGSLLAAALALHGDRSWRKQLGRIEYDARGHGALIVEEYLGAALGMQELAEGNAVEAIQAFGRCVAWQQQSGHREPLIPWWPADLVEAQLLAGDHEAARRGTEALRTRAQITRRRRCEALVARLDGLQAGPAAQEHFERSIVLGEEARDPYGVARTQLVFGRFLRRGRQRTEARHVLSAALETFERLDARSWVDQTCRELEASGVTVRARDGRRPSGLTPQEAQVAELVASGASNKEVAGTLFLSPKTIEAHLSRIYRKLDVTSRTQLAVRLRALSEAAA